MLKLYRCLEEELKLELQLTLQHQNNAGKVTTWGGQGNAFLKAPFKNNFFLIYFYLKVHSYKPFLKRLEIHNWASLPRFLQLASQLALKSQLTGYLVLKKAIQLFTDSHCKWSLNPRFGFLCNGQHCLLSKDFKFSFDKATIQS